MEGIRLSKILLEEADLLFWIVDAHDPVESINALQQAKLQNNRTWVIFNKIDLEPGLIKEKFFVDQFKLFEVSSLKGDGLDRLLSALEAILQLPAVGESVLVTHQRHYIELERAGGCLERLQDLIRTGVSREIWAEELREALLALGRIRGRNLSSAAFEEIFSKFCIGK